MWQIKGIRSLSMKICLAMLLVPMFAFAESEDKLGSNEFKPVIGENIITSAKKNNNWKLAFTTGKDAQVVFMSITPMTNPKNEIGMETHAFDQVIFVVEGKAKAVLDGKEFVVKKDDMIFIPQGKAHNFINLSKDQPFKIISIYSKTDIPENAVYLKSSDVPQD